MKGNAGGWELVLGGYGVFHPELVRVSAGSLSFFQNSFLKN
jgi:hypothetical protein